MHKESNAVPIYNFKLFTAVEFETNENNCAGVLNGNVYVSTVLTQPLHWAADSDIKF